MRWRHTLHGEYPEDNVPLLFCVGSCEIPAFGKYNKELCSFRTIAYDDMTMNIFGDAQLSWKRVEPEPDKWCYVSEIVYFLDKSDKYEWIECDTCHNRIFPCDDLFIGGVDNDVDTRVFCCEHCAALAYTSKSTASMLHNDHFSHFNKKDE